MPCLTPPPAQVSATIEIGAGPTYPPTFEAADAASAPYIDGNGNLDFSCFPNHIKVKLIIETSGITFYTLTHESLLYADNAQTGLKTPVQHGHYQFPGDIKHDNAQTISFTYANRWDCGKGDGSKGCAQSAYGLDFANSGGYLRTYDPIIGNGGSPP